MHRRVALAVRLNPTRPKHRGGDPANRCCGSGPRVRIVGSSAFNCQKGRPPGSLTRLLTRTTPVRRSRRPWGTLLTAGFPAGAPARLGRFVRGPAPTRVLAATARLTGRAFCLAVFFGFRLVLGHTATVYRRSGAADFVNQIDAWCWLCLGRRCYGRACPPVWAPLDHVPHPAGASPSC